MTANPASYGGIMVTYRRRDWLARYTDGRNQ